MPHGEAQDSVIVIVVLQISQEPSEKLALHVRDRWVPEGTDVHVILLRILQALAPEIRESKLIP